MKKQGQAHSWKDTLKEIFLEGFTEIFVCLLPLCVAVIFGALVPIFADLPFEVLIILSIASILLFLYGIAAVVALVQKIKAKRIGDQHEDGNEKRARELVQKYGFDFAKIPKGEIEALLEAEIRSPQAGSSEYLRVLCGYLYCLGDASDVSLLEKAKYGISMDVGCMIDAEWIESLQCKECVRTRNEIIKDFVAYYGRS